MKKGTKIILGVVIGVLVLYSAFMTLGVYVVSQDYNELSNKYREVLSEGITKERRDIDDKMNEITESAKLIPLEAFASVIDENAVVNLSSEKSAIIRLSMGEKNMEAMVAKMKEYISILPSAMEKAEIQTCILCIVDNDGDVKFGYTFHPDGTSTTFLSDK